MARYVGPKANADDLATQGDLGGEIVLSFDTARIAAQTNITGTTKLAEITGLTPGRYMVYALVDWLSVPASSTFAARIRADGGNREILYVTGAISRVGQTVMWTGPVTGAVQLYAERPIGTGTAIAGGSCRITAIRIG